VIRIMLAEDHNLVRAGLAQLELREALKHTAEGIDPVSAVAVLEISWYMRNQLLRDADWASMAHSLEVRPPFLDHRILEFASTLPENLKIRGGQQKFLLRHLMRDRLPKTVLTRSKTGFDIPAHAWLRRELRPLLMDTLSASALKHAGIFRPESIQSLIAKHMDRTINVGYHLWGLMTLHLWLKTWNVDTCTPLEQEVSEPVHAVAS